MRIEMHGLTCTPSQGVGLPETSAPTSPNLHVALRSAREGSFRSMCWQIMCEAAGAVGLALTNVAHGTFHNSTRPHVVDVALPHRGPVQACLPKSAVLGDSPHEGQPMWDVAPITLDCAKHSLL